MSLPNLVAVLRPVTQPGLAWRAAAADPAKAVVRKTVTPLLHAVLAEERPGRLAFWTRTDLQRAELAAGAAFVHAWSTLDPTAGLTQRADGLWQLAAGDGHDASRLTIPGWLASFRDKVGGAPIAVAPHARLLLVGGEEDALAMLEEAEHAWRSEGTPISPAPYAPTADRRGIAPWIPPSDHPAHTAAALAHRRLMVEQCEAQRRLLGELWDGVVFAQATLDDAWPGGHVTAHWPAEVERPLLPVADTVLFPDGTAMPWAELAATIALEAWPGLLPPRAVPAAGSLRTRR